MTEMIPLPYVVTGRRADLPDTVTLTLEPVGRSVPPIQPGQFTMLYAWGIGEVAISVSGTEPPIQQTVRAVGAVSRALVELRPGQRVGVRGPYGTGWDVPSAAGRDLVFAAGGIGLAPLRGAIRAALAHRAAYGRITVLVGARTPRDLLYPGEYREWRRLGARVEVTVDHGDQAWSGHVGLITDLVGMAELDPGNATAFLCGPEAMMRFTAQALAAGGMPHAGIRVSLERNMRCGIGWCGHCQLGSVLLCRDGPVLGYDQAAPLLSVKEL